MNQQQTLYQQLGGMERFHRLANAFYDRIETDDLLRPMFPTHLNCARKHLALFLAQFFGGPADYTALRGSPRLRMRHLPFQIGQAERDRWLFHMLAAMEEVGIPEPARSLMAGYFLSASTFLINQPAHGEPAQVPAQPAGQSASAQTEVDAGWSRQIAVDRILDAVRAGDPVTLRQLLEDPATRDVLSTDRVAYRDILAEAFRAGNPALAQEARTRLEREPDLIHVCSGGITLLHEAAGAWSYGSVEFLLDLGADVNAGVNSGHPPLYYAANRFVRHDPLTPEEGGRVVRLLLRRGADPNAGSGVKQVTALHMAARRGHVPIAVALIEHGADLEARDSKGETPLRRAVNCGHAGIVALLLAHGVDPKTQDNNGRTPLQAARTPEIRQLLAPP